MDKVLLIVFVVIVIVSIYIASKNNEYVKKNELQEKYERIKIENKRKKAIKRLSKISWILIIMCLVYLGSAGLLGVITVGFMDYTMGNVDTNLLSPFLNFYFNYINYIPSILYLAISLLAVRALYIQLLNHNELLNARKLKNKCI